MDDVTAALATAIGARVKAERQARRWTLDQLAEAAEVSRRQVVNIEQGDTNPSVGLLLRLSDALGVGLPALVDTPRPAPVEIVRDGDGAALWTGEHGGRGLLVAGTAPPDVVELWDWTLARGEAHRTGAHAAGTRELLQVQKGILALEVGDDTSTLKAGDAASFTGDIAHGYANAGTGTARFVLAVFEPGVGSSPR